MFYVYVWIAAQIIIEMLPISSSGHLELLELFLKKFAGFDIKKAFPNPDPVKAFYYFLHGQTLIIICGYFFSRWCQLIVSPRGIQLILCLIIADLITLCCYFLFQKIKIRFPLGLGFLITALALFSTAWCSGDISIELLSFTDAAILGLAQGLALLSGISRLALTCSIGCWLGFSLIDAFFLSWMLQAPLMAGAFAKSLKDLYELGALKQVLNLPMSLVMLGSSGISAVIMGILVLMIRNNTYYYFGWYMLVPLLLWIRLINILRNRDKNERIKIRSWYRTMKKN